MQQLLGDEAVQRIRSANVLLVGAGGIGCEVLKELVVAGFGTIAVVDLDTIDLSNLNRQFLFTRAHVKHSKAEVACEVAGQFNSAVKLVPFVANIMTDERFTLKWFSSFSIIFNALDNAAARGHVNKMCVAAGVPLIDCGSAGFAGQSQVIIPHKTECYDCRSHPPPKTFPVCTIRSTPSQLIHCVVWAKSVVFQDLFGGGEEVDNHNANPEDPQSVLNAYFVKDIERLLLAKHIWKHPPQPLKVDLQKIPSLDLKSLDDQLVWTQQEALAVLRESCLALAARKQPQVFDKDDDEVLDFVAAAAVLRAQLFGIPAQSRFQIKQMAGNIIPSVATTNAVVSGLGVVEALKLMRGGENLRDVTIFRAPSSLLVGNKPYEPRAGCVVCDRVRTTGTAPPTSTLGELVTELERVLKFEELSVVGSALLYDPDFDDQAERTLEELKLLNTFITVADEDGRFVSVEIYLAPGDKVHVNDVRVPLKPTVKRAREEEDDNNLEKTTAATEALKINAEGDVVLD